MKRFPFTFSVLFILLASTFIQWGGISIVKASPDIHQGDLILQGNNVTIIEGRFDINGSIIVEENATLILRNALLNFTQKHHNQHNLSLQNPLNGHPRLLSYNTTIASNPDPFYGPWLLSMSFYGNSSGVLDDVITYPHVIISAYDSANVSISESRLYYVEAADSSLVQMTDSSSSSVSTYWKGYSNVRAFNCTISSFWACGAPIIDVVNSTTTEMMLVIIAANFSANELELGFITHWNLLLNCSVSIGSISLVPNITLKNTLVEDWSLFFRETANATLYNCELHDVQGHESASVLIAHSELSGEISTYAHSNIRVLNSTLNGLVTHQHSKVCLVNSFCNTYEINDNSSGYISWYLDAHVTDSRDENVPYANVTATYPNATSAGSQSTDLNGWVRFTLLEKMINATDTYHVGNYTVEATYDIHSASAAINMTENKEITLKLEDFVIPEFPSLLILPLFMVATLLAVIVYRRKSSRTRRF